VNHTVNIREARWLPAVIASVAILTGAAAITFSAGSISIWFGVGALLAAIFALYRAFRPRSVLRIDGTKLLFNDLIRKRTIEIEAGSGAEIRLHRRTELGGEGLGFWSELTVQTSEGVVTLPLPLLEVTAKRAHKTVVEALSQSKPPASGISFASHDEKAPKIDF
jgi:hypothetical protein